MSCSEFEIKTMRSKPPEPEVCHESGEMIDWAVTLPNPNAHK